MKLDTTSIISGRGGKVSRHGALTWLEEAEVKFNVQESQATINQPHGNNQNKKCRSTSKSKVQIGKAVTLWLTPSSYWVTCRANLSMVKISQLLSRTEQSFISRPLNLRRHNLKQKMKIPEDQDESTDAILKAKVPSFVKRSETLKSNCRTRSRTDMISILKSRMIQSNYWSP